jgi:hypothetical protein
MAKSQDKGTDKGKGKAKTPKTPAKTPATPAKTPATPAKTPTKGK